MYYYFAATLPMIHFDSEMPFSIDAFIDDCRRLLSRTDFCDVLIALGKDNGDPASDALRAWQRFLRCLKKEIAWSRASRRHQNSGGAIQGEREFDVQVAAAVAQASRTENLLEAQRIILRLEWDRAEQLSLNNFFSIDAILMYGVKLQLLERLNAYKSDRGSGIFEEMTVQAAEQPVLKK